MPFLARHRYSLAALTFACFALTYIGSAAAGGYVDGSVVLNPATAIGTGGISITPTFNNDQFNDRVLVGTVNNDAIRTPSTADPVSTVSGNNYHDETDFVIRGRNGLNIVFTRTYNSAPSATSLDRGLGHGWTHSYLMRLESNDFGDCPNCTAAQRPENANTKTSSITYTDERGGEQNFLVNETTFAVANPKGVYDTLALDAPVAGQHTLTFRNGVKYIFETPAGNLKTTPGVSARLKYVDNAWGDRLTLSYDGSGRLSTLTDSLGIGGRTGLVFTYHPDGHLKDVTDWSGRKWDFAYSNGDLTGMTNPLAQTLTYTYHPGHLLHEIIKPLQRDGLPVKMAFQYYQNGRAFNYANSLGHTETLDYDLYRKSTRVTDPRGFVREYFYDDNGRMTKLVEPDGGVLLFENQADAVRSVKYDALGYAKSYSYRLDKAFVGSSDAFGQVTREQDALDRTVDYTYGPLDQIATVKDKRGTVTTTTYAAGTAGCDYVNRPKETRLSALSGAANVLLASYCWNADATLGHSRQYLDATRYRETRLTYEPGTNGLNVQQQQLVGMPSGVTITRTYTYDNLGRVRSETLKRRTSPTDATLLDLTTAYDYDALDRVTKVTDPLGNEAINRFDANGALWQVTHRYKKPDGSFDVRDIVTRSFDAADRIATQTDAESNLTRYQYDEAGNLLAVTDAEHHTTRYEYDAMNRRSALIEATGYRTQTRYNLRGEVAALTNANRETVSFEYDALGRQSASVDAKGYRSEYAYDDNGNRTCAIDANAQAGLQPKNSFGCSEYRQYDELNRLTKLVDALDGESVFTYDLTGNRLTLTDAEHKTWRFGHDDLGRLTSETDHAGRSLTYQPDQAGNLYETTNRLGEVTRTTYDSGNRATRVDYLADASAETFGYDPAGNLASAANPVVGYAFFYDRLNRLTTKLDSRGRSLGFTYDKVSNLLTKTTYQGSTTAYLYNAANRLTQLTNPDYLQVDYHTDPAGRLLARTMSSGASSLYDYDANGWLTRLTQRDAAGAILSEVTYTRDRLGHITGTTDQTGSTVYGHDPLYRLTSADYPGSAHDEAYAYDKVGNRTVHTTGGLVPNASSRYYLYASGTDRLAEIRIGSPTGALESAFSHDLEGRLTTQSGPNARTLTWDAKGRLRTLTRAGTETYAYDPMDYRIARSGGALGSLDYFLEGEHLESVYSGTGIEAKYLRGSGIDELVAGYLNDQGTLKPYLFHHDHLTSTSAVSGHNGGAIQSIAYGPFGTIQANAGTSPNRLKYTGREDDGTGLYYYRARYYDAAIGRFISEDPLGFAAGEVNFYAYVGNGPVDANDPSGQAADIALDAGFIAYDVYKLVKEPSWVHAAALGLDVLGAAIPFATGLGQAYKVNRQLTAIANQADQLNVAGRTPRVAGTLKHSEAERAVNAQLPQLSTEISYKASATPGTNVVTRGTAGSKRADVVQGPVNNPTAIYDFKFGEAGLTSARVSDIRTAVGNPNLPVVEIRPGALPTRTSGLGAAYNFAEDVTDWFGISNASASGGFLLYPSKLNSNMSRSVYSK